MQAFDVADTGFDIGWDFARFGRALDRASSEPGLLAGYRAGREHFRVPQHRPDRFVSKWLQIRLNAFRRRRIFDHYVTSAYLRRIDCSVCPIILISMTHAALTETDWSVDRINNRGVSARALSYESPTVPTDGSTPASTNRSVYRTLRYCDP